MTPKDGDDYVKLRYTRGIYQLKTQRRPEDRRMALNGHFEENSNTSNKEKNEKN